MIRSKVHNAFLEAQLRLTESPLSHIRLLWQLFFFFFFLAICSPCGTKSSASDIYFMCTEICVLKSLGDWHGLEEPRLKLNKNHGRLTVRKHTKPSCWKWSLLWLCSLYYSLGVVLLVKLISFNFMNRVCLHGVVVLQDAISVADVILWSALYPVLSDSCLALSKYNKMKMIHNQRCISGPTT